MVCSILQIAITIAIFTGVDYMMPINFDMQSKEVVTYELYIALSCLDFFVILFSAILLYGNERTDEGGSRCYLVPWLILIPFYVIYESAINIFYFYNQFNDLYANQLYEYSDAIGFHIVPLVYWVIKDILLFIGFVFLIVRFQSLCPQHVQYVEKVDMGGMAPCEPCRDVYAGPTMHTPVILPSPPACTSCSGGCSANRCPKCNLAQPSYGYAGPATSGWMTSIYAGGR